MELRTFRKPTQRILDDCGSRFRFHHNVMKTTTLTATLQPSLTIQGHAGGIWSLVSRPDDRVISGGADGMLRLWKLAEGDGHAAQLTEVSRVSSPHSDVVVLHNTRSGKLLSTGPSGGFAVWNVDPHSGTFRLNQKLASPRATEDDGHRILETAGGKLVTWGPVGQEPLLWDWLAAADAYASAGSLPDSQIVALAEAPGGRLVSGRTDGRIVIWEMSPNKNLYIPAQGWVAHDGPVRALCLGENGLILSAGTDLAIKIWQVGDQGRYQLQQTLPGHTSPITGLVQTRPGEFISSDPGKQFHTARWRTKPEFRIWHKESGGFEPVLRNTGLICRYLPHSLIVDTLDDSIGVWSRRKGTYECVADLARGHEGPVVGAEALSRGRLITAGPDGCLALWDIGALLKDAATDHTYRSQFLETGTRHCL